MRSPVEFLKKRIAIRRLDWGKALQKGEQLLKSGKAAESIPYFRQSIRTNPGEYGSSNSYESAKAGLAEALKKSGQQRKAAALLKEMTPVQYWLGVVRGGFLVTGFIVGGGAAILFGSIFFLHTFVGQEVPPITLALHRGKAITIDIRFESPVDISARAAAMEPAARYEGLFPWVVRPWKGFEHRAAVNHVRGSVLSHAKEVVLEGQQRGLIYEIGEPDIVNRYGGSKIHISADNDIPAGLYKIWLAGAYIDHTRRTKRFNPDILIWQAGPSEKETVPRDTAIGVPVIEVTVVENCL